MLPIRRHRSLPFLLALLALLGGCALPQRAGIPTRWVPSPNFDARRIGFVVIHYTSNDSLAPALKTLTSRDARVSAHYLIARDGEILQLVDERARAWHAGDSRWGTLTDLNSVSIGIELDNDGVEPYPPALVDSLLRLLADLRQRHRIPSTNYVGHSDIAPLRKVDPGPLFPWRLLASQGFGLWCDAPEASPPLGYDPLLGLRTIGYDTREPAAAIVAFRTHFVPELPMEAPLERDSALIRCLADASVKR